MIMDISDFCTGLKWSSMIADQEFPVAQGSVVTLSCEVGHQLTGGKEVTCGTATEYQFDEEPQCSEYILSGVILHNTTNLQKTSRTRNITITLFLFRYVRSGDTQITWHDNLRVMFRQLYQCCRCRFLYPL